jgi:hypothetical protein
MCIEPTERNLAQLARPGNVARKTFHHGAPRIAEFFNVTVLGPLDGPVRIDHYASHGAVAYDGNDTHDKRSLGGFANGALSMPGRLAHGKAN